MFSVRLLYDTGTTPTMVLIFDGNSEHVAQPYRNVGFSALGYRNDPNHGTNIRW